MYLLYIIGHYMYWGHNNSPHMTYLPDWWPVGERIRWFACRSWHYVHHDAMGSLYVGQKSWDTEDSSTGSALSGWKFYLCNARNAPSYAIPDGLATRDSLTISCFLRSPAKTERRHNIRGATISLGALINLSSLFTKWGEIRVFLKMPKRLNRWWPESCNSLTSLTHLGQRMWSRS